MFNYRETLPFAPLIFGGSLQRSKVQVVSVAERGALRVWLPGHKAILKFVRADRYLVIVPDQDVEIFRALTDPRVTVESEEFYISGIRPLLEIRLGGKTERLGWYLQQFIKFAAIRNFSVSSDVVIWDADTVPLRRIDFFSPTGVPNYFVGTEHHAPYFDVIRRCLGLEKVVDFSFVAQSFPVCRHHAQAFFNKLDNLDPRAWFQPVLDAIDFTEQSGFSEYEMLGTFVSTVFPSEYLVRSDAWLRNGWAIYRSPGAAASAPHRWLHRGKYSFCSFEAWQDPASYPSDTL